MNTEHTKHPFETVEASADVMKLAEMILSDCGQSTVISDSLQRRVAGRIQQHMDSALGGQQYAEPVALSLPFFAYDSEVGFERFATEAEAKQFVQEFIDEYRHEAGEGWPEEVESLCWGVVLGTTREVALPDEYSGDNGLADDMKPVDYVLADAAQQPAVPNEWRSPSDTPIVALGDALHCWLAVKSKHDSKVRVYDAYYCNFPLMQDEAGDFPDWTLHDESGEEVAMVGWAEKVAHPDFNDFYSSLGDIELIGWQPVNPPVAPTAAQKGGA